MLKGAGWGGIELASGSGGSEPDRGGGRTARGCSRSGSTILRYEVKTSGRSVGLVKGNWRLATGTISQLFNDAWPPNLLVNQILFIRPQFKVDIGLATELAHVFLLLGLFVALFVGHPDGHLPLLLLLSHLRDDVLEGSGAQDQSAPDIFQRRLEIPNALRQESSTPRPATIEAGDGAARSGIRRLDRRGGGEEARHVDLRSGKDVDGEEVGKAMVGVGSEEVQDGIVGEAEVPAEEIEEEGRRGGHDGRKGIRNGIVEEEEERREWARYRGRSLRTAASLVCAGVNQRIIAGRNETLDIYRYIWIENVDIDIWI